MVMSSAGDDLGVDFGEPASKRSAKAAAMEQNESFKQGSVNVTPVHLKRRIKESCLTKEGELASI